MLYLASGSPRRAQLLAQIGVVSERVIINVDESVRDDETPIQYVERLALAKARAGIIARPVSDAPVLGSDTAVVLDERILGKPRDQQDAAAMLSALSGRDHWVYTSVCVTDGDRCDVSVSASQVWFKPLTASDISHYWLSGEPRDKAGGYGIQGLGAVFIKRIEGSYSGIMGLPLYETAELLREYGVLVSDAPSAV